MPPTPVAIALGSNVGDRAAHLAFAVAELSRILSDLRLSRLVDTEPVGVPDAQSRFLNAAVVGTTLLEPGTLLAELLAIERLRGRARPYHHAPRTLDLDLILYGDDVIESPDLVIFRTHDIEHLVRRLELAGHRVFPLTLNPGSGELDRHVDLPPYKQEPHLRLMLGDYVTTSLGLIAQRAR